MTGPFIILLMVLVCIYGRIDVLLLHAGAAGGLLMQMTDFKKMDPSDHLSILGVGAFVWSILSVIDCMQNIFCQSCEYFEAPASVSKINLIPVLLTINRLEPVLYENYAA